MSGDMRLDLVVSQDAETADLRPLARLLIDLVRKRRQRQQCLNESEVEMAVLTVSSGGVPSGSYTGKFIGVETVAPNQE